jgi:hypothetical protein
MSYEYIDKMSQIVFFDLPFEMELMDVMTDMAQRLDKYRERNTRAARKYRATHRAKINSISKKYYDTHKEDPEWLQQKREKQRIYQQHRRLLKRQNQCEQAER